MNLVERLKAMTAPGSDLFSYLRFSDPVQAAGRSEDRQLEGSRGLAEAVGLTFVEEMSDRGKSAFHRIHKERGALGAFLELVRAGEIKEGSVLIVENIDRLGREDPIDQLNDYVAMIRAGIILVILHNESIHSRETLKQSTFLLMEAINEMIRANSESVVKHRRGSDVWAKSWEAVREGRPLHQGILPYWLKRIPKKEWAGKKSADCYLVNERMAKILRRIFREFAAGDEYVKIAEGLNADGIPTFATIKKDEDDCEKIKCAKGWRPVDVKRYVSARSVTGILERRNREDMNRRIRNPRVEEEFPGHFPAVIDEQTFAICARRIAALKHRFRNAGHASGGGAKTSPFNPFSRIAKGVGGGLKFFRTESKTTPGKFTEFWWDRDLAGDQSGTWNLRDFLALWIAVCRQALKTSAHLKDEEKQLAAIQTKIAKLEEEQGNLVKGLAKAKGGHELIAAQVDETVAKIAPLKKEEREVIAILKAGIPEVEIPTDVDDREGLGRAARSNVKTLVVDCFRRRFECSLFNGVSYEVEVSPEGRVTVTTDDFVPERIEIEWVGKLASRRFMTTRQRAAARKTA